MLIIGLDDQGPKSEPDPISRMHGLCFSIIATYKLQKYYKYKICVLLQIQMQGQFIA